MKAPTPIAFFTGAPGGAEIIVIFVVVLLLYGPRRLPEVARRIGRIMAELRRASQEFRDQIMSLDRPTTEGKESDLSQRTDLTPDAELPDSCDAGHSFEENRHDPEKEGGTNGNTTAVGQHTRAG
ncbi:MAG: Sec-independent protein translocase subunit TatA/TatB [Kiritimatiellia bacterium]